MALWLFAILGCSRSTPVENQTFTVACGMCVFELGPSSGCYWAAEVDGGYLKVTGPGVPTDHDAHGPGGMCTMRRQAVIDGTRSADMIWAERFELLPAPKTGTAVAPTHRH